MNCPICNKPVDPQDAERHAKHHVRMGEVGDITAVKLIVKIITAESKDHE